jgi:hypothetical protein
MSEQDETWRLDMALDYFNRLPESQRETFKEAYMKRVQERSDAGEVPVWQQNKTES